MLRSSKWPRHPSIVGIGRDSDDYLWCIRASLAPSRIGRRRVNRRLKGCISAPVLVNLQLSFGSNTVIDSKTIDQFMSALSRFLPKGPKDVEKNLRAALQGAFDRLNLVSREEIEVQEQVLARTRARLQELEKKIAELEEKLAKK